MVANILIFQNFIMVSFVPKKESYNSKNIKENKIHNNIQINNIK